MNIYDECVNSKFTKLMIDVTSFDKLSDRMSWS